MQTLVFEGVMTALTSISHIGDSHGVNSKLRREKIVQPDGSVEEVPIISGNALRGILRDRGMLHMLKTLGYGVNDESGEVKGLSLAAFYFLFSGGALTSTGGKGLDVDEARKWRGLIPLVALFGGAMGNQIMPGKAKIGKAIPICSETAHILPERFVLLSKKVEIAIQEMSIGSDVIDAISTKDLQNFIRKLVIRVARGELEYDALIKDDEYAIRAVKRSLDLTDTEKWTIGHWNKLLGALRIVLEKDARLLSDSTVWEMCQEEAYTRRDDEKNENLRTLIAPEVRGLLEVDATAKREKAKKPGGNVADAETGQKQQMRYYVETLSAGTRLYWELSLDDVTDLEREAFFITLAEFSKFPYIGGKSGVGHGKVNIKFDKWIEIDSRVAPNGSELSFQIGSLYQKHLQERGDEIRDLLNGLA